MTAIEMIELKQAYDERCYVAIDMASGPDRTVLVVPTVELGEEMEVLYPDAEIIVSRFLPEKLATTNIKENQSLK